MGEYIIEETKTYPNLYDSEYIYRVLLDNGDFFDVALMSLDPNHDNIKGLGFIVYNSNDNIKGLGFTVYNSNNNNKQYSPAGSPIALYTYNSIKLVLKDFYEKDNTSFMRIHAAILEEWRKGGTTIVKIYIDYYKSEMIEHLNLSSYAPFFIPKRHSTAGTYSMYSGYRQGYSMTLSIPNVTKQPKYVPSLEDTKENIKEYIEEEKDIKYECYTPYEHLSIYRQIYKEIKEIFFRLFNKRYRNNSEDEYV